MLFRIGCIVCSLVLASCTTSPSRELASASAISFAETGFCVPKHAEFSWRSNVTYLFDSPQERPTNFQPYIQQEIESHLAALGHTFDPSSATLGVVAVAMQGAERDAAQVLREFRLTPSFPASRRYPRGTLVIAIYTLPDKVIRWRGAIQVNIDVAEAEDQRRARVRTHVSKLLNLLPLQQW